MAEHSPAPWHTGTDEDGHIVYDANAGFVADAGQDDDAELEEANLHLIAAAPDLLAKGVSLNWYIESIRWSAGETNTQEWLDGLRELIDAFDSICTKAKGGG